MNLCNVTLKQDAARLGTRWILKRPDFNFSASLGSVYTADPELFDTRRETSRMSLKARVLKGLKGNLFEIERITAHGDLKS